MAPFNPPLNPLNPQDYGSKSRAVDIDQGIKPQGVAQNQIMPHGVMQGDESAKYAGEAEAAGIKSEAVTNTAYGDLFKDIAATVDFAGKGGVEMVKKDIEGKVYAVADKERQAYTDILEKVKAGSGVKNVLDSNAEMTDEEALPADVANLPDTLNSLQGARDSGKVSGSYYQSRLLAEAKSLRAQYPGFREYIDQTFSKVTGSNPANAYVHSLVQDINRNAASTASQKNKMLNYIIQNPGSIPNQPQVYDDYQKGLITDQDVLQKAYPYEKAKADLSMSNMQFNNANLGEAEKNRIAGLNIDKAAGNVVNMAVDTITSKMGLNTPDDVKRLADQNATGGIDGKAWQQYGQTISNTIVTLRNQMIADSDKHGYTQAVGGKAEALKRIEASLEPLKGLQERVYNHDFGGIYDTQNQLKSQNDETKKGLLNDPKIGPYMQQVQAFKDIGGEQNLQKFFLDTVKSNFSDDYKAYFNHVKGAFATQSNMKTTGVPYTFNDTIDNLKANNIKDGRFNEAVLNEVQKIADKSLPKEMRMNYALAAFSSGNRGMISRLQADEQGKTGQTAVFQRFTSPEMTKAIVELGKENPQILENYKTWAKETLGNELIHKEIQNISKMEQTGSVTGTQVGWDPKNHRFLSTFNAPAGSSNQPAPGDKMITSSVNRMNGNIDNYKRIAEATGEDPDAFILKSIADSAGPEALKNVTGIPYQLMRSMGLARMNVLQNGR